MLDWLESVLFQLKDMPGLGFLENYWIRVCDERARISSNVSRIQSRRATVERGLRLVRTGATKVVRAPRNIKGSKKR